MQPHVHVVPPPFSRPTFHLVSTELPNSNGVACKHQQIKDVSLTNTRGKCASAYLTLIVVIVLGLDCRFGLDLTLHRLHEVAWVVRLDYFLLSCRDHLA